MNTVRIKKWLKENSPRAREKLAHHAEISVSTVDKIQRGHEPTTKIIRKIAAHIGVPIEELIADETDPPSAA